MYYYIVGIANFESFDLDNVLIDENSYKNILFCNISYKTLIGTEPFPVRFNRINGFMRVFDGIRYLALFGGEKYDFIYNKIRYDTGVNSSITYFISHNYIKIKIDSYDLLRLEKNFKLSCYNIH